MVDKIDAQIFFYLMKDYGYCFFGLLSISIGKQ